MISNSADYKAIMIQQYDPERAKRLEKRSGYEGWLSYT